METGKLIQQRDSLLEKLRKLEIMKTQIRDIVYSKIKDEYTLQLNELNEKLEKEKDYLKEEIVKLKEQESEILSKMDGAEIESEELNVRFTLNEFSDEEYQEKKKNFERIASDWKSQLKSLTDKRHSFEEIVGKDVQQTESIKEPEAPSIDAVSEEFVSEPPKEEDISLPIELSSFDSVIPETALVPPEENDPSNFKEITIEEKIPEVEKSSLDNIISADILKDESFSLGEDVSKEEKLVNANPLEAAKGQKDDDLNEFAKMLDNQITPLNESQEPSQENIEGLICPKCAHVNKSDLFNCEKCGAELL